MTDAGKSFIIIHTIRAVWAKRKAAAAGKNPSPGVAQLVARLLWEQDAAGSNPVTRTTFLRKTAYSGGFSAF